MGRLFHDDGGPGALVFDPQLRARGSLPYVRRAIGWEWENTDPYLLWALCPCSMTPPCRSVEVSWR